MNPLHELRDLGQSIWLDSLERSYLGEGAYLDRLITAEEIDGLTSNPSIFQKALDGDDSYDEGVAALKGTDPREALWRLMKEDVGAAADQFLPRYEESGGTRGFVSIELDPSKAYSTEESVSEGLALFSELGRPNVMVKVPGTEPGLETITRLIAEGVNVNVTLLFSVQRYESVMGAWLEGLRRLEASGGDVSKVSSVASFFVSRVDSKIDDQLGEGSQLRGSAGIANARKAYAAFETMRQSPGWRDLEAKGAHVQRPLWASTSVKDDAYSTVMYIEELAGPETVNTMPEETLDAAREQARVEDRLTGSKDAAQAKLDELTKAGVDLDQMAKELEEEGVEKFEKAFDASVDALAERL